MSTLRKGKIDNPGFEKLRAIAKIMGFPPEMWFEDVKDLAVADGVGRAEGRRGVGGRLQHLFGAIRNDRTGEPYTVAEVARMSMGDLTEEEVEGIRDGRIESPTVAQVLALSDVFGIHPSYFLEDDARQQPLLDEEAVRVLSNQKSRVIAHKSLSLSEGEKDMVLDMIEHLGRLHDGNGAT